MEKKLNYPLLNFTIFMFLLFISIINIKAIMAFFVQIMSIFLPFFIGFIVAYAINPFVVYLRKYFSKRVSVLFVIGIIIFIFTFLVLHILPMFYHQFADFILAILKYLSHLEDKFLFSSDVKIVVVQFLNHLLERLGTFTSQFTLDFLGNVFSFLGNILVGGVSFFYFLYYMDQIRIFMKRWLCHSHFVIYTYLLELDSTMGLYLKSVGKMMFVQFIEYSFLFFIIGHPDWLVLGLFIGLFTAVPYIGGFLSNLLAMITSFTISKELFLASLVICFVFPIIDEYFISPKIYGNINHIHPVLIMFLLSIGGSLGGVLGVVLAIPIFLFFRTTYLFFQNKVRNGLENFKDVL